MKHLVSIALGLSLCALSGSAAAEISAGVFGGYGFPTKTSGEDLFRFGYGARAGYSFIIPIYLGAQATFQQGSYDRYLDERRRNYLNYYGLEAGVDLTLGSLGIRPIAVAGLADIHSAHSFISPYFGLGVMPTYRFLDLPGVDFFVGADVRLIKVMKDVRTLQAKVGITEVPVYLCIGARI